MNSNYISCNIVEKYGEDDFSLWTVDISEADYKTAMQDFVRVSGSPISILNGLPTMESKPETVLHFIFSNTKRSEIISTKVDDGFIARYRNQGCSVRGSWLDILDEIRNTKNLTEKNKSVLETIRNAKQNPAPRNDAPARKKSGPER